ncbi:MAG: FKBP-type peptidyl-prolyl cis-trans isomerase, partial [Planctomycetota bacterium]
VIGRRKQPVVVNVGTNTVVNQVVPKLIHANPHVISSVAAPTVNALAANTQTPTITGTWDSAHAQRLTVAVNGVTHVLGQDAKLSSPSAGTWALNLTGTPLPGGASTVTATNSDTFGNTAQGSGVVTTPNVPPQQLAAIDTFLTTNQLTSQRTSSGLSYVITTPGTGVVPTNGKKVTVNYTGRLLNLNGTLGTVFDSNVDPQFGHVQPFQFTVGQGQVIKGWDEAFLLLPVGTVAKLLIPSLLGYGTTGSGTSIPPNSILVFDVTLLSVQ